MGVDTGGLQQPDELGEGFPVAIVRGRGGQDEGIGIGRQGPGQTVVLSGVTSDVVGLVNDDGVPFVTVKVCLLYTSPSPRDLSTSRMPSSA